MEFPNFTPTLSIVVTKVLSVSSRLLQPTRSYHVEHLSVIFFIRYILIGNLTAWFFIIPWK